MTDFIVFLEYLHIVSITKHNRNYYKGLKRVNHAERVGRKTAGLSSDDFRIQQQGCQAAATSSDVVTFRLAKEIRHMGVFSC